MKKIFFVLNGISLFLALPIVPFLFLGFELKFIIKYALFVALYFVIFIYPCISVILFWGLITKNNVWVRRKKYNISECTYRDYHDIAQIPCVVLYHNGREIADVYRKRNKKKIRKKIKEMVIQDTPQCVYVTTSGQ